jgi:NAD(P)-dependent dehydrogenase (short-subunit alcohol dehydrogenase family)
MSTRPLGTVSFRNDGRVVLVSGGAQGIGRAICQAFADSGACVASIDVQPAAQALANVYYFQGDTSCEQDCRRCVEVVVERFGGLDVLVNNAAIQPPDSYVPLDAIQLETWNRMLAVNFTGYTLLAKYAVKQMLDQSTTTPANSDPHPASGVIINMASRV